MTTSNDDGDLTGYGIPLVHVTPHSEASEGEDPVPFPTDKSGNLEKGEIQRSTDPQASSAMLTSSDKLSALPSNVSLPPQRMRPQNQSISRPVYDSPHSLSSTPPSSHVQPAGASGSLQRGTASDGSGGKGTPRPRRDSGTSLPSMAEVRQALFSRKNRRSDPTHPSTSLPQLPSENAQAHRASLDSPSPSRAASPLRSIRHYLTSPLHRYHSREEPFIPVDPFKFHFKLRLPWLSNSTHGQPLDPNQPPESNCEDTLTSCLPQPLPCSTANFTSNIRPSLKSLQIFFTDTFPRQLYLHLLLRFPSLYFSRVARVFEDAEVSKPDIQRMIEASMINEGSDGRAASNMPAVLPFPEDWNPGTVSPALARFKYSWESLIESLLREWKTLNLVSALLLSAILTMFQIPSAADDPLTRTAALLSLICALMSLIYGCVYIVRFGAMRSMYKASRWAEEARNSNTSIAWNVWVFLSMPSVWLAWSLVLFVISILSFVWRTDSSESQNGNSLPPKAELGTRISITAIFVLGLVYFALIVKTLRTYGTIYAQGERRAGVGIGLSLAHGVAISGLGQGTEREEPRRGRDRDRRGEGGDRARDERDSTKKEKERSGLRSVLGLGLTGFGELGSRTGSAVEATQVDLEKGEKEDAVTTVDDITMPGGL